MSIIAVQRAAEKDTPRSRYRRDLDPPTSMPMTAKLRHTLLSFRDLLATAGPFILLAIALLALAYWLLDPTPPQRVVLATGPDQGAFAEFGKRYAQELEAATASRSSCARRRARPRTCALLRRPEVGRRHRLRAGRCRAERRKADDAEDDALVSLGSLFYEPVWLFYRKDSAQRLLKRADADEPRRSSRAGA